MLVLLISRDQESRSVAWPCARRRFCLGSAPAATSRSGTHHCLTPAAPAAPSHGGRELQSWKKNQGLGTSLAGA